MDDYITWREDVTPAEKVAARLALDQNIAQLKHKVSMLQRQIDILEEQKRKLFGEQL
jgi:hypothetical protein